MEGSGDSANPWDAGAVAGGEPAGVVVGCFGADGGVMGFAAAEEDAAICWLLFFTRVEGSGGKAMPWEAGGVTEGFCGVAGVTGAVGGEEAGATT